jgi:hypothetical protein
MAAGQDGTLFVSIPQSAGSVLARLDRSGRPRPGWPITVKGSTSCELLEPVDDGSVRLVCTADDLTSSPGESPAQAFAFDAAGRPLAGWPIDLPCCPSGHVVGRVVGDELTLLGSRYRGETVDAWIVSVAADGSVRNGTKAPFANCCAARWSIGPDRVAYGSFPRFGDSVEAPKSTKLVAVGVTGAHAGFPIAIDGLASEPSFDAAGRIHVTVTEKVPGPARTVVFDSAGRTVGGSGGLEVRATDECVGIEGTCEVPAAPLVGPDGTTFVVGAYFNGTAVAGVSPSGQALAGWPYRSDARHQTKGICPAGAVCEGSNLTTPALGLANGIYLLHGARANTVGGNIVAVGPNGRVRPGWPVELRLPGSAFWSVVVGPDGTAYALAIEPESGASSSATVLAIAPNGSVPYRTTIIDP